MIYRVHCTCVFIPLDLGVPGLSVVCVLAGLPPLRIVVWRSKYMYMYAVLLCLVCLFDLACFFLSSLINNMYMYMCSACVLYNVMYMYMYVLSA